MQIKPRQVNDSLSYLVAILRKDLIFRKYFSTRWRSLYCHQSQRRWNLTPFLEGIAGSPPRSYIINQLIAVIPAVGKDAAVLYIYVFKNRNYKVYIIPLPFADHYADGIAVCIHGCMNFCAGPAPAVADFSRGGLSFLAPALCWWA